MTATRASCTATEKSPLTQRERVLDRRLVPDEGEGAARGLRGGVHRGGGVVGVKAEREDRRWPAALTARGRRSSWCRQA